MEEQISSKQVAIKWGAVFGLAASIYTLGTAIARVQLPFIGLVISWGIIIGCFVMACREYKSGNEGTMSFGKGFGIVMLVSLIGGLIRSVIYYVYLTMDADYIEYIKEQQQNSPFGPPRDQAQDVSGLMEFFTSPEFMSGITFLMAIFGGLILGAIVAAIMKNEEEEF